VIDGIVNSSTIGNNVRIGKNSIIKDSVIYDNAIINDNTNITYSVIGEKSIIGNNCDLKRSVVGSNEEIKDYEKIDNKSIWNQPKPEGYPDKQIGNPIEV
jgi:NDP-sugar pyrophosphorylase family protein